MSQPFGAPLGGAQQPVPPGKPGGGAEPIRIGIPAVAGAGLAAYLLALFDTTAAQAMTSLVGFTIIAAAVLAGLRLLPKAPNTLFAAAPLAAFAALGVLLTVVSGNRGWSILLLLVLSAVQLGGTVWMLMSEAGMIGSKQQVPSRPMPAQMPPPPGQPPVPQPLPHPPSPGQVGHPWSQQGPPPRPAPPPPRPAPPGQAGQQPPWWAASPPGQQPGGADPSSGGSPVQPAQPGNGAPPEPGGPPSAQHDHPSGPQGTRQMPDPGKDD